MQAIEFDKVDFSYSDEGQENKVLSAFDFAVEKGAFIALLGRNGSGKSTVAKLINALLTPKTGKVVVLGYDTVEGTNVFEIRKRAGMVFQNPDNQQIASIVEDDIAFGPENIGVEREEIGRRIDYSLKATDMEKYRYAQVARLSGGQKQRVAIAGVLAINPDIIILDESTSMLDPKGRQEVMDVVRTLNREHGITVIDITHYMDEAVTADEVYIINNGKLATRGKPSQVFSQETVIKECGLELPRASIIAMGLNKAGVPVGDGIFTKEELAERLCKLLPRT